MSTSTLVSSASSVNYSSSISDLKLTDWMLSTGDAGAALAVDRYLACGAVCGGVVSTCENGHSQMHPFSCMLRTCPTCAARRSRELARKLAPAIYGKVAASSGENGLKHLTLGTDISLLDYLYVHTGSDGRLMIDVKGRNTPNSKGYKGLRGLDALRELIIFLKGCVADMLKDHFEAVGAVDCGFAVGVEFGHNLILHFHVLALMPYWAQKDISNQWRHYNGNRGFTAFIEDMGRDERDVRQGVVYVTKYVTKPLSGVKKNHAASPNEARAEQFLFRFGSECVMAAFWYLFKGVRRFQTYGSFYRLEFDEKLPCECPECGGALTWKFHRELVGLPLNSLSANYSVVDAVVDAPKWVQKQLFGGWGGVDFWK